jgi:endonuclease/exonuclease/phosphatase (EEP) superfamily protein YafD
LVAVHPASPYTKKRLDERNQYLTWLASELSRVESHVIVAGDFNATPFTPAFKRFRAQLSLDLPHYAPATFPAFAGPFGLAIDHILARGVRFERIEVLPIPSSDHRGLFARIVILD